MRLRTLGAVCATCAAAAPSSALAAADPATPAAVASIAGPATAAMVHATVMRRLIDRHVALARVHAALRGERLTRPQRRALRASLHRLTPHRVRARSRTLRREIRHLRHRLTDRYGGAPDVPIPGALAAIARCESHGDPRAVSASGTYRGKYQFSYVTWGTVDGTGDPARASETEQDRRAALLYRRDGPGQWPVCGR